MPIVTLAHPTDWPGFRQQARALLLAGTPPEAVHWQEGSHPAQGELFAPAQPATALPASTAPSPQIRVPAEFLQLCPRLLLHREPSRLALLYRLLWRLQREPQLRADPLDPDIQQARRLLRAVNRDIHHLHGFVRFRPVAAWPGDSSTDGSDECWQVAWYEPQHRTLAAAAPYFTRRLAHIPWAILTPDGTASWDTRRLHFTPPEAQPPTLPAADAGESLWLTYYASTFNPTRLKLATLRRQLPVHYWKNLPEAALIEPLAATAQQRLASMV